MSGQRNGGILFGLVLAVSLVSSALAVMLTVQYDSRVQFAQLRAVCAEEQGLCGGQQQKVCEKVYEKEKRYLEQMQK